MSRSIKRRDTKEAREFWDFVERTSAYVRSHALCYANWCVADGEPGKPVCPVKSQRIVEPSSASGAPEP